MIKCLICGSNSFTLGLLNFLAVNIFVNIWNKLHYPPTSQVMMDFNPTRI